MKRSDVEATNELQGGLSVRYQRSLWNQKTLGIDFRKLRFLALRGSCGSVGCKLIIEGLPLWILGSNSPHAVVSWGKTLDPDSYQLEADSALHGGSSSLVYESAIQSVNGWTRGLCKVLWGAVKVKVKDSAIYGQTIYHLVFSILGRLLLTSDLDFRRRCTGTGVVVKWLTQATGISNSQGRLEFIFT